MTAEERERIDVLIERMKVEKDYAVFTSLVREFQEIIHRKEQRLQQPDKPKIT